MWLTAIAAIGLASSAAAATVPLEQGWQHRWGDDPAWSSATWDAPGWADYVLPGQPPKPAQRERWLWLRVKVPAGDWREPALKLDGVIGHFELFLDGQQLFQHPPGGVDTPGVHGMPWFLIPLPPAAAGKTIAIRSRTSYFLAGVVGSASVGDRGVLIEEVVRRDVGRAVIGGLMGVIGLLALLVLVPVGGMRLARGFALFSICAGVYTIHHTQLKQLAFDLPAQPWFVAWCFSVALMPVGTLLYVAAVFGDEHPLMRKFRLAQTWLAALYILTVLGAWAALERWGAPAEPLATGAFVATGGAVRVMMLISSTGVVWRLVTLATRPASEERTQARIMLVGATGLFLSTALAVSGSFGVSRYGGGANLYLGLLAMVLAWAVVAGRVWSEARRKAVVFARQLGDRSKEKEAMLRDLHDGIGGVTTHIRLLAELGKRDGGKAADALSTIAELSTEGLAELRAFTQTLDEAGVTWPDLCSELRRYGGQLIEAHGKAFEMTANLQARGRPSPAMCLAVLRVFREALTNIVKHAEATKVVVEVEIDGGGFRLKIADDGAGSGSGGGLDTGRGVNNMRSRARELGGELTISREAGTQLLLRLPIPNNSPDPGAGGSP